jgi:hypothetical protein
MKYRVVSLRKDIDWGVVKYALRGFFASLFVVTCAVVLICIVVSTWILWTWSPAVPPIVNGQMMAAPPESPALDLAKEVIYYGILFGAVPGAIAGVGVAAFRFCKAYRFRT